MLIPLTVTLDRKEIVPTQAVAVTVHGSPNQHMQLIAYSRPSSTYHVVRDSRTDSNGDVSFSVTNVAAGHSVPVDLLRMLRARGERVLGLTSLRTDGPGLALATKQGVVKRVTPDWPVKGDAFEIVSLKAGDEVVGAVELADGEEELVFFTSTADLLRFPADAVRPHRPSVLRRPGRQPRGAAPWRPTSRGACRGPSPRAGRRSRTGCPW